MVIEERLPPACAFAMSVLAEHELDPEAVPEEAVEAAQQHIATCTRCVNATASGQSGQTGTMAPRRKKKVRRVATSSNGSQSIRQTQQIDAPEATPATEPVREKVGPQPTEELPARHIAALPSAEPAEVTIVANGASPVEGMIDCQQCRQVLQEYAEALDRGLNVALLYPEVQEHLLNCEAGCLVLLDFFRQEAKATRKYRRRPIRDPFSVIGWEASGFFRGGQISMSPRVLAYGTLIFLILIATLGAFAGFRVDESVFHAQPITKTIPTPDGIGLSDGLKIFDACNATGYQDKRAAAQAMQANNVTTASHLLTSAVSVAQSDTSGCNGAEAAIYQENLQVRQSGRAFGVVVVSFDSGPGSANPQGGTDRHILYAAYTQELIGAFIAQQQYNQAQMSTPGAPLLYLVLANTTGIETGALQIANTVATLATTNNYQSFGLLARGSHALLGVLGLGPSSLLEVALPTLCRIGIPLIAPTATGRFIIDLIDQTSLYKHCASGFSFIRFSPDDLEQSTLGARYAYTQLKARNAAVFYDPSNPSSNGSAQGFISTFSHLKKAHIVAYETAVASGLLDANGRPQASPADLLAGLNDALRAHPDVIFAPLLTNDVTTIAQAIARLPQKQQPILIIGGEFVQPTALQGLVQWTRQHELALPKIYAVVSAAARPATSGSWQKQFYASFCSSFDTPGSYCSGAGALDQGALLFGDGIELVARAVGPIHNAQALPTRAQLVKSISKEQFAGVSCPIKLHLNGNMLVTSLVADPVVLSIQGDGSIQIVD